MSKIISIGTAVPEFGTQQSAILQFMQSAYNDDTASRKLNVLFHQSNINTRYSALPDFDATRPSQILFTGNQTIPGIEERLSLFKDRAIKLAVAAISSSLEQLKTTLADYKITHLITVSCTGIFAPGIDAVLTEKLNLPDDIFHTSFNFLGCNAAFHALKLGDMIAKTDENARILIVCVELCTLHFQPKNNHDNLLSNTIFGDGAAAVIMVPDPAAEHQHQPGLILNGFYSLLLNKGKDLMGWNVTPVNFEMILDARVPEFIGEEVNDLVFKVGRKFSISPSSIDKWAIHPGGKKILDTLKKQLTLKDDDLQYSYKVLSDYGNMSSPTILFVLDEIMKSAPLPGETVFSIGFGPGLSIETAVLTYAE